MQENQRLIKTWSSIEHWLSENFPETLDNLYPPAFQSQIDAAEETLDIAFPHALKDLLLEHNGENSHWPPGIFPNGHRFLPVEDIVETWFTFQEFGGFPLGGDSTNPEKKWLPISMSESKTLRIVDFDPPEDGIVGQVAEVTPNKLVYRVLAPSLVDYLEQYALDLAVNKYYVKGDYIVQKNPASRPLPNASKKSRTHQTAVRLEPNTPPVLTQRVKNPAREPLKSAERVIIVGELTSLIGKEEILFSVKTENGKEYAFVARPSFTKGFNDIAIDQRVRILAKPFQGDIKNHFIEQGLANKPDFVAFEYTVLVAAKNFANIPAEPLEANIDQLAHDILDSIRVNANRSPDYKEVKAEFCPSMRARFYNDVTERLLKLGFHYTADLQDPGITKSGVNSPAFFRVMSFFDDGIVASFYHIKPKLSWPFQAARKVLEFETELSDGHIIISTTAEDEMESSLPANVSRYVHPATIPVEGLLYKHRSKIRRYQTHHPKAGIVKVRCKNDFITFRQRRQKLIHDHLRSIGWVTRECLAKQFSDGELADQVYNRIKHFVGSKGLKAAGE